MKDETHAPARHLYEHDQPIVIHDPEADMTILGRWVHRGIEQGARFWLMLAAVAGLFIVLALFGSVLTGSRGADAKAWEELEAAKTPDERVEIAKNYAGTSAAHWGLIQAANDLYVQGFGELPASRDTALPRLKKALDLYQQVAGEAPKDQPVARIAALGAAKTLEARNELDEARTQYKAVVSNFPETLEAEEASRSLKELDGPGAADFYKQFYAYKPAEITLPPGGGTSLGLPPNHPALDGPTSIAPPLGGRSALDSLLSPGGGLPTSGDPLTPPPSSALPEPPPAPADSSPTPEPKAEPATPAEEPKPEAATPAEPTAAPPVEAPKPEAAEPAPNPAPDALPDDPFSPAPQG